MAIRWLAKKLLTTQRLSKKKTLSKCLRKEDFNFIITSNPFGKIKLMGEMPLLCVLLAF